MKSRIHPGCDEYVADALSKIAAMCLEASEKEAEYLNGDMPSKYARLSGYQSAKLSAIGGKASAVLHALFEHLDTSELPE